MQCKKHRVYQTSLAIRIRNKSNKFLHAEKQKSHPTAFPFSSDAYKKPPSVLITFTLPRQPHRSATGGGGGGGG